MAKQRRSNRKVHRGRRKKRGFSTWSLGKKIGVIFVSMLLVIVIGGGAAAALRLRPHQGARQGRAGGQHARDHRPDDHRRAGAEPRQVRPGIHQGCHSDFSSLKCPTSYFFFLPAACFFGPLRVRAFCLVFWPRTGRPRR